jgi:hypothetical protein
MEYTAATRPVREAIVDTHLGQVKDEGAAPKLNGGPCW